MDSQRLSFEHNAINKCNFNNLNHERVQVFLKLFSTQKKTNNHCAIAFYVGNVIKVQSCELAVR